MTEQKRQLAMVINLDKCIGCQACTTTCATHHLNRPGCESLYYIWCETKPGPGWPKGWMEMGERAADPVADRGGTWTFNWEEVYRSPAGSTYLRPIAKETGKQVEWGPAWDEDQGAGQWPNGYFFYMPRLCNHCSNPPCVKSCEDHCSGVGIPTAMSKREEDGVVTINPQFCDECGLCAASCRYKIPIRNGAASTYELCDFCSVRVERGYAPVCAKSCPARAMYFGYLDDEAGYVHKLVKEYRVALPLRPDFGSGANVYYVPPFVRPRRLESGNQPSAEADIPIETLRAYFGPEVDGALATLREHRQRAERGEGSDLMDTLIIYRWADAFTPFEVEAPQSPTA